MQRSGRITTKTLIVGLALLGATAGGTLRCVSSIPYDEIRDTTGDVTPIFRSQRQRPMHVTYYMASIEQEEGEVTIDLDLSNGFGHRLGAVTTWVTLHGEDGESLAHPHAVGPMAPHATHRVILQVKGVEFTVDDVEVGVQIAP